MTRQASTHAAANIIRELYGENKMNLREISIFYNTSISTVKRIVDNSLFHNMFYVPTKRDFESCLGSLMKSEGYSLKRITEVCSVGKVYSAQGALNKINKYDSTNNNRKKD